MSRARRRLRRLEAEFLRASCTECGGSGATDSLGAPVEIEVVWEDPATEAEIQELRRWYEAGMPEEEPEEPIDQDEYCPRCGRQTLVVIDWHDAPSRRELRRLEAEMLARRGWDMTFLGLEPKEEGAAPGEPARE